MPGCPRSGVDRASSEPLLRNAHTHLRTMAPRRTSRLLLATAAAVLLPPTTAYIYSFPASFGGAATTTQTYLEASNAYSEGPMYASNNGPFGMSGDSSVGVGLHFALAPDTNALVVVHAALLDDNTRGLVGYLYGPTTADSPPQEKRLCCPEPGSAAAVPGCDGRQWGDLSYSTNASVPLLHMTANVSTRDGGSSVGDATATFPVTLEGRQDMLLVACLASPSAEGLPLLPMQIQLTFANPYGYLPAQLYGMLPTFGVLFVGYLLLLLAFGGALILQRKYVLKLQYIVLAVILLGVVETVAWFIVYESKNRTGIPNPCADVCPTTADYVIAALLSVAKRWGRVCALNCSFLCMFSTLLAPLRTRRTRAQLTPPILLRCAACRGSSRALLLAVSMGFGVVHPTLDRRSTLLIAGLTAAYCIFGVMDTLAVSGV